MVCNTLPITLTLSQWQTKKKTKTYYHIISVNNLNHCSGVFQMKTENLPSKTWYNLTQSLTGAGMLPPHTDDSSSDKRITILRNSTQKSQTIWERHLTLTSLNLNNKIKFFFMLVTNNAHLLRLRQNKTKTKKLLRDIIKKKHNANN